MSIDRIVKNIAAAEPTAANKLRVLMAALRWVNPGRHVHGQRANAIGVLRAAGYKATAADIRDAWDCDAGETFKLLHWSFNTADAAAQVRDTFPPEDHPKALAVLTTVRGVVEAACVLGLPESVMLARLVELREERCQDDPTSIAAFDSSVRKYLRGTGMSASAARKAWAAACSA